MLDNDRCFGYNPPIERVIDLRSTVNERKYYSAERQGIILELLNRKKRVEVSELSSILHASAVTIREDLTRLEALGKLTRTHGGAVVTDRSAFEYIFPEAVSNLQKKKSIAAEALLMIHDGDTVFLDTGSTANEVARLLESRKDLTVVLYDIKIAQLLERTCESNLILLGGNLRRGLHSTVGPIATQTLSQLRVDKAFITTASVNQDGFATSDIYEAEIKSAAIKRAREVIMLADSTKFDKVAFNHFASFSEVNTLITDSEITQEQCERYTGFGVNLRITTIE